MFETVDSATIKFVSNVLIDVHDLSVWFISSQIIQHYLFTRV